ncbi:hypothetical protein [Glutamicibacter arilaitensis]|uniref:hypothetical protein n=1 Tax=Glutamicibacter arilaitensis TaxID=256701 RepID=UPI0038518136
MNQTIIGLDLSLTSTGLAIHQSGTITTHRIQTKGKRDDTWQQRHDRMNHIVTTITSHVPENTHAFIEAPAYSRSDSGTWDRAGLWWMTYTALQQKNCAITPIAPNLRTKYALGKGGGKDTGKDNVLAAAIKRYTDIDITGNDIADATIILAMGLRLLGQPIDQDLPQTHLAALATIQLPEGHAK